MKKAILILLMYCLLAGGTDTEIASDELQPGPYNQKPTEEFVL